MQWVTWEMIAVDTTTHGEPSLVPLRIYKTGNREFFLWNKKKTHNNPLNELFFTMESHMVWFPGWKMNSERMNQEIQLI